MTTMRTLAPLARACTPYLSALGIILLSAMLVATVFLTEGRLPWQAFLGGALMAATIALASRTSNNAWTITRRTAQLEATRTRLASETVMRNRAERALENINTAVRYMDELLPAMVAYVDRDYRIAYHNRAYAHWLGAGSMHLEGRTLQELFGEQVFEGIRARTEEALNGQLVRYERVHMHHNGVPCRISVQCLPHFAAQGAVAGLFIVLTDITTREDMAAAAAPEAVDDDVKFHDVADRLAGALAGDEFILFAQKIASLDPGASRRDFREVLLRLKEEEENLMPPGEFLPLAEMHGLMPDVDRWVIEHLVAWALADPARRRGIYSVNLSAASLHDPLFVGFAREVAGRLQAEGPCLCFEVPERDALANAGPLRALMSDLQPLGILFAVSAFGRSPASFELLKRVPADFVKIDAGLVLCMSRGTAEAARVTALARVARARGIATIAECVEDEATVRALRSAGVDYAQGFVVARPQPLEGPGTAAEQHMAKQKVAA
jgi:PAS domain S-box-containing protein